MESISLERIDIVESKMRALQEEVTECRKESEELKKELNELCIAQDASTILQMQATTQVGGWIMWDGYPHVTSAPHVSVLIPGTYQVIVIVNVAKTRVIFGYVGDTIQLMKENKVIQSVYCRPSCESTFLVCVTHVEKNEHLYVKCPLSLSETSYLTLIRIGK